MQSITFLYLDNNAISGTLPPEWGRPNFVDSFTISRNHISGTIPKEWLLNMSRLYTLWVDGNQLTGAPSVCSFQQWAYALLHPSNIASFRLDHNMFSGQLVLPCLPADVCSNAALLARLKSTLLDGNHLCGVCSMPCNCSSLPRTSIAAPSLDIVRSTDSDACCGACTRYPGCVSAVFRSDTKQCELKNVSAPLVDCTSCEVLTLRSPDP